MIMCLIGLQWVLFGYSLAFGPDFKGLIGDLSWLGLRNVSCALPHWDPVTGSSYAGAIPHQAFMTFQMMFAVITPAAGFVNVNGALWIGIGAGVLPWICISVLKPKLNFDDALDVFGVHGVGGLWGALATGLWATKAVNPAGADGLFYGQPGQFLVQLEAVAIVLGYSLAASYGLLKLVDWLVRLRVNEHEERVGLDLTQHREAGYTLLD
jgi:ammonia channel protein AmtB